MVGSQEWYLVVVPNLAMENPLFIDGLFPIKNGGCSIARLVYQEWEL